MGKASSSKKVARAASTGGGRTSRGRRPVAYYSFIFIVALLGSLLLLTSRNDLYGRAEAEAPTSRDHWHQAYGIYICDAFLPNPSDQGSDTQGIHTHADGLIHIHPFSRASSGKGATLGKFMDQLGMELSSDRVKPPGDDAKENGDKCGKKEGEVRLIEWDGPTDETGQFAAGDPEDYRLKQDGIIVIAFISEDTKVEDIPKPASVSELANPSDVNPTASTLPEGAPGDESTTTTPPSESTTTSTP